MDIRKKLSEAHIGQMTWNKGIKTGLIPKTAFKDGDIRISGANSHLWKNGISKINKSERELAWYSGKYRRWRKAIFTRDDYICRICGNNNGNGKTVYLHADHIKPWALYPKLRYEITNGQTLCVSCHLLKTKNDADLFVAKRK